MNEAQKFKEKVMELVRSNRSMANWSVVAGIVKVTFDDGSTVDFTELKCIAPENGS